MRHIRRLLRSCFSCLVYPTVPCGWGTPGSDRQGIADLSTVIGCRDDMVYLMHAGLEPKMAFTIMERVRKGMWLKISEGQKYITIRL